MARKIDEGGIRSVTFKAGDGPEVTFNSMEELGNSEEFRAGVKGAIEEAVGTGAVTDFAEAAEKVARRGRAKANARKVNAGAADEQKAASAWVPAKISFMGSEFIESQELEDLAEELIARYPELQHLSDYRVRVLWKAEGGDSKGMLTLGKCIKPGGPAKYFALCDWVIWLAADHCRQKEFDDTQIEALLYHELKHCILVGKDAKPGVRGHDFEVFADELHRYGFWTDSRAGLKAAVQGRLQFEAEEGL